jgi:hypothetical protein
MWERVGKRLSHNDNVGEGRKEALPQRQRLGW